MFWVFFCNEPSTTKTKIVNPLRLRSFRIQNILYRYMYHTVQTHNVLDPSESINHFCTCKELFTIPLENISFLRSPVGIQVRKGPIYPWLVVRCDEKWAVFPMKPCKQRSHVIAGVTRLRSLLVQSS